MKKQKKKESIILDIREGDSWWFEKNKGENIDKGVVQLVDWDKEWVYIKCSSTITRITFENLKKTGTFICEYKPKWWQFWKH